MKIEVTFCHWKEAKANYDGNVVCCLVMMVVVVDHRLKQAESWARELAVFIMSELVIPRANNLDIHHCFHGYYWWLLYLVDMQVVKGELWMIAYIMLFVSSAWPVWYKHEQCKHIIVCVLRGGGVLHQIFGNRVQHAIKKIWPNRI